MSPPDAAAARPRITLIVAQARNRVIGRNNTIPWHLSEDLRHFKATTLGHTIVMGRKTFESIGRPLPGRDTIVVTRSGAPVHPEVRVAASLPAALAMAGGAAEIFIAGGAKVYEEALALADRLIVTEVELEPDGDVRFPPIDPARWRRIPGNRQVGANGTGFTIVTYERRDP